jgi:DNA-binding GntR family transcriptional regulator
MSSFDLGRLTIAPEFAEKRVTADFVADALREAIQSGSLPDGAILNQAALAERFAISRQPVREAMRQLLAEGLVEHRAHYGSVVRGLPVERLYEIYDNRAVLEGWMLERATPRIPAGVIAELRQENQDMTGQQDVGPWLVQNTGFHTRLVEFARDETALELVSQLRSRADRYVRMWSGLDTLHHPHQAGDEHEHILDAIAAGDAAGARALLEEHVRSIGRRLVALGRQYQSATAER